VELSTAAVIGVATSSTATMAASARRSIFLSWGISFFKVTLFQYQQSIWIFKPAFVKDLKYDV
jgi:hypothetical protein